MKIDKFTKSSQNNFNKIMAG